MRFLSLIVVLVLFFSRSVEAAVFNAKEYRLDNGLLLVVVENNKAPLVAQYLCYHVGRIDEEKGKSGLAHLHEHMMFKGNDFSLVVDRMGGSDNAFTTNDMTCYHQSVATEHLEDIMRMEASRMRRLSFKDNDFRDEKKVVMEERVERTESRPEGAFFENSSRIFYEDTPYAIPTIGYMDEIKSLKAADVKDFHRKWYVPNNAVLVISGAVSAEKVKKLAEKYYGGIRRVKNTAERVVADKGFLSRKYTQEYLMKHANVSRPQLVIRFHAPSFFTPDIEKKKIYALDAFAESVGGSTIGKLYQELVVKEKLLISVSVSYSPYSRLSGEFIVSAIPADGYNRDNTVKRILELLRENLTDDEIKRVRERMKIDMVFLAEKPLSGAQIIAPLVVNGLPLHEIENYVENLNSFTTEELNSYKKDILKHPFTAWLEPDV